MTGSMGDFGLNQPPPYVDVDLFGTDLPLREAVAANGAAGEADALGRFGRHWGRGEMFELARLADIHPPVLEGEVVEFHPAYHRIMAESRAAGLHASTWNNDGTRVSASAEVARAARFYMVAQVENGHMCPITMTRASVAALSAEPKLLGQLAPKLLSRSCDPAFRPVRGKIALSIGMGMTEKQGGTDVRTNTTEAIADGEAYRITGHKWFMSAPMSDGFLVLAQASGGLSCFYMPRFRPDYSVNGLHFQKLKDKLGNRSNASSEVEFRDAYAVRVGEEGRGIRTILNMVQLTRLDCAISSAGIMRAALARALHNSRYRVVFQKKLIDQPAMRAVLADLALEVEGATAAVMRLCRSFDLAGSDPKEALRARVLTPAIKYWICKAAPGFVYEAMECLGGNGYVEDYALARLYREAPVNAIWEGSGNAMALDLLRAMSNAEEARALITELMSEARGLPGMMELRARLDALSPDLNLESQARWLAEQLALLAATAALQQTAPRIAQAFAQTRIGDNRSRLYGAAPLQDITSLLLERAHPA
jgi:putative acyl-CoA dehydrogenase